MRNWAMLGLGLGLLVLAGCGKGGVPGETPPTPEAAPVPFSHNIDAHGADPSWALTLRGTQIVLTRPGLPDMVATAPGAVMTPEMASWTAPNGEGRTVKLTLYASSCTDGLSGTLYPFSAEVDLPGDTPLGGCAGPTPGPRKPAAAKP